MPKVCSACGCSNKYYAKGLCSICYQVEFRRKRGRKKMAETKIESLEGEIWKDIPSTNPVYQVSNLGRVKRLAYETSTSNGKHKYHLERLVTITYGKLGYGRVSLWQAGKNNPHSVHRLVALTFIPNPEDKPHVNHIDGNPSNNKLENLEWCTCSENRRHQFYVLKKNPLIPTKAVRCIETGEVFPSLRAVARHFGGTDHSGLSVVLDGKHHDHHTYKGYHWEYI